MVSARIVTAPTRLGSCNLRRMRETPSRRRFLQRTAAASIGVATAGRAAGNGEAMAASPFDSAGTATSLRAGQAGASHLPAAAPTKGQGPHVYTRIGVRP